MLPDNLEKTFNLPNKHLLGSSDDSGAMLDTECILYGGKNKNADMTFTLMELTVYRGITELTTKQKLQAHQTVQSTQGLPRSFLQAADLCGSAVSPTVKVKGKEGWDRPSRTCSSSLRITLVGWQHRGGPGKVFSWRMVAFRFRH